jgi:phosphatidylethanolamine-binding protein (PEBP) family uncharacterized protein
MLEKLSAKIGQALRNTRAGFEKTVIARLVEMSSLVPIEVSSPAFQDQHDLPVLYTTDGAGLSPPLEWRGVPPHATFLALIVEDADSPTPHPLVHAIVVNIPIAEGLLREGALSSPHHRGIGLPTGPNSYLSHAWLPPDPPPGHGAHRYVFQLFAFRGTPFKEPPGREELVHCLKENGVGAAFMIGTYERFAAT